MRDDLEVVNNIPLLSDLRDKERTEELKKLIVVASLNICIPLWSFFWIADWICYPEQVWNFLPIRIAGIIVSLSSKPILARFGTSSFRVQAIGVAYCFIHNLFLTYMVFMTGGSDSIYWVDLNIVVVAGLTFLPWTTRVMFVNNFMCFGPYYIGLIIVGVKPSSFPVLVGNLFFNMSMIIIALATRIISEKLRTKELEGRLQLRKEIALRDSIIKQKTDEALELELHAYLGKQASQIAHDIRSPLSAFRTIASDLFMVPEAQRIILRSAIHRMTTIASTLQDQSLKVISINGINAISVNKELEQVAVTSALYEIVAEKEIEHRSVENLQIKLVVDSSAYSLFAKIDEGEFKRIVSNLVNNSVEAGDKNRDVLLQVIYNLEQICIEITDFGKGIPAELLPKLGERGNTFGKQGGKGLGLFHAKTQIERWGGDLEISSTVGVGTTMRIILPRSETPSWFLKELVLCQGSTVVVLDDEPSIHLAWKYRFEKVQAAQFGIKSVNIYSPQALVDLMEKKIISKANNSEMSEMKDILFLIDFEFAKEPLNGLDLIERLGISKSSILVSSRYFEEPVLNRCKTLGVKVVPKLMAGLIPIELKRT